MPGIAENYKLIQKQIEDVAFKIGRDPADIKLIAVSKTFPVEFIKEAIRAGIRSFGESYVQEALKKIKEIGNDVEWHFIGNLQTNKVKYIIGLFSLIHSVDRINLAEEIDKRARQKETKQKILLEVNISGEETKSGVSINKVISFAYEISKLKNLEVEGLMTMAPYSNKKEDSRHIFHRLRELKDELNTHNFFSKPLKELSMGMTNDFEIAIEEGATMLRIGTGIFGNRET